MKLRITCGLVVYDEVEELRRLIPQIQTELQDYDTDWIFVLNHEQKKIRLWISDWLQENMKDSFVFFENPLNNLGFARQVILSHSPNELIYMTDPDIEILPESIHKLIQLSLSTNLNDQSIKIAGFGGTVNHQSQNSFIHDSYEFMSQLSRFLPFAFQIQNHRHMVAVDHLPACHLLLKKSAALDIGGFSYQQPRCGEDTDFTHRAYNLNYRFLFLPSAEVNHWQNLSGFGWLLKIYLFGRAQINVQKKNYKNGIRIYRLIPILSFFMVVLLCFYSKYFMIFILMSFVLSYLFNSAVFGFILVLISYSLGELSELIWPLFESKSEVPLQELNANLTFQVSESKLNNQVDL
jgi:GT2 family glycosyltransferase